jgi:hypothetical protein
MSGKDRHATIDHDSNALESSLKLRLRSHDLHLLYAINLSNKKLPDSTPRLWAFTANKHLMQISPLLQS